MDQSASRPKRVPKSRAGKLLINLLITAVVGFVYFYVTLPAINLQASEFYTFVGVLCVVYVLCALVTSGMNVLTGGGQALGTGQADHTGFYGSHDPAHTVPLCSGRPVQQHQ